MEKLVRKQTIENGRILETRFHFVMINNQRSNLPVLCLCVIPIYRLQLEDAQTTVSSEYWEYE